MPSAILRRNALLAASWTWCVAGGLAVLYGVLNLLGDGWLALILGFPALLVGMVLRVVSETANPAEVVSTAKLWLLNLIPLLAVLFWTLFFLFGQPLGLFNWP